MSITMKKPKLLGDCYYYLRRKCFAGKIVKKVERELIFFIALIL